jgi:hypothetical protein
MSRHWPDSEELDRRLARACIVSEYGPDGVTAIEYLRRHPLR